LAGALMLSAALRAASERGDVSGSSGVGALPANGTAKNGAAKVTELRRADGSKPSGENGNGRKPGGNGRNGKA
jgi:hypothetical protein